MLSMNQFYVFSFSEIAKLKAYLEKCSGQTTNVGFKLQKAFGSLAVVLPLAL